MSNKVSLGTVEITQPINGIEIKIPIDLSLGIVRTGDMFLISIDALANLRGFQDNTETIIKTFPLPKDLSGYGTKFKIEIENAKLLSQKDSAYIEVNFDTEIWQIEKGVPLGGTTIEWENRCINLGLGKVCTKVPVKVEPRPGADIKTKLVSEGINAKVSFALSTPDGKSIKINYHDLDVNPRGDVGRFLNDIAEIFNKDINSHLRDVMDKQITQNLKVSLPDEIEKFNPDIKTIQFKQIQDGSLGIFLNFETEITGKQLNTLIAEELTDQN